MFQELFRQVRACHPLIHNITNYVTVNDCANITLACGASPIMADDQAEVAEITAICAGLNLNIGTLNSRTIASMHMAGAKANALGHPVVLDPVGAGASQLRTDTALALLRGRDLRSHSRQRLGTQGPGLRQRHHQRRGRRCLGPASRRRISTPASPSPRPLPGRKQAPWSP